MSDETNKTATCKAVTRPAVHVLVDTTGLNLQPAPATRTASAEPVRLHDPPGDDPPPVVAVDVVSLDPASKRPAVEVPKSTFAIDQRVQPSRLYNFVRRDETTWVLVPTNQHTKTIATRFIPADQSPPQPDDEDRERLAHALADFLMTETSK